MKMPVKPRANTPHSAHKPAPDVLIVAASARALAQSATKSGLHPAIIDAFGDRDARACAVAASRVPLAAGGLDRASLQRAFRRTISRFGATLSGWVAGPGLENCIDLVADFAAQAPFFGNDARVFERCASSVAPAFAADCGLPLVPDCAGYPYLSKMPASAGGTCIGYAAMPAFAGNDGAAHDDRRCRRQTYLPGVGVSHLFAASGEEGGAATTTIGFSTQWHSRHDRQRPFTYGGAINRAPLDAPARAQAEAWAKRLAKALGLRGLNNADYLYCAGRLYFLELNPRPSATMALYDADYPQGLLAAHVQACRGRLPGPHPAAAIRAQAVVYAQRTLALADDFEWPEAACDVPAGGGVFDAGTPLCSLTAEGGAPGAVLSELQQTLRYFTDYLNNSEQSIGIKDKYIPENVSLPSQITDAARPGMMQTNEV